MTHTVRYNHAIHSIEAFMNCGLKWIVYIAVHLGSWVSLGALSSVQLVYSSGVSSNTPPLPHSVMRERAEDTSPFRMRAAEC